MAFGEVHLVIERELALLSFQVRRLARQVDELLDPEFREIGASGRCWTRGEIVAALAGGPSGGEGAIQATEMAGALVGPDLVLLTYVSDRQGAGSAQLAVATLSRRMAALAPPGHLGRRRPSEAVPVDRPHVTLAWLRLESRLVGLMRPPPGRMSGKAGWRPGLRSRDRPRVHDRSAIRRAGPIRCGLHD
jgi:hypothetical protein